MGRMYRGKCRHGLVIYGAIANTPIEQADCASDIKQLVKKGFTVELIDSNSNDPRPEWCFNTLCKKCKRDK